MDISAKEMDGVLVVRLEAEVLDAVCAPIFKKEVLDQVSAVEIYNLVFDLEQLKFIDSSGLGAFLSLLRYVKSHDGDLKFANVAEGVVSMFKIVRMNMLFEFFDSPELAVASFARVQ